MEGCVDRKLKHNSGERSCRRCSDHHPGDQGVDADRRAKSQPYLKRESDHHRRNHESQDQRLLRSVIRLKSFGRDETPSLIVDEALHAISTEAISIQ